MINVLGHLNPDSDAVCTAVVTAYWLTHTGRPARAWRSGEANRETRYIFNCADVSLPEKLSIALEDEKVWLVDFTEPAQGPSDLHRSNIVGILDHHRLGGLVTRLPPEVFIRPVGSSATLLWMLMPSALRASLPKSHAILLLGAVLSDTIDLRSPTTTADDVQAVRELSTQTGISRIAFTEGLLKAKTDLSGLGSEELLNRDLKAFVIAGIDVRIAQIEVSSTEEVNHLLAALRSGIEILAQQTGAGLVVLMLTDIVKKYSTLYFAGPEKIHAESCSVPDMLSRKRQLLPWLNARLDEKERML